jgi:hypothetical protein
MGKGLAEFAVDWDLGMMTEMWMDVQSSFGFGKRGMLVFCFLFG